MTFAKGLFIGAAISALSTPALAGTIFTDAATFDAATGPLAGFEDFEEANIGAGVIETFPAPLDATTDNGFFSPGDIAVGLTLIDDPLNGLSPGASTDRGIVILGDGAAGTVSTVVGSNNVADTLVLSFSVPVDAVGFNAYSFGLDDPNFTIEVLSGMTALGSAIIATNQSDTFFGFLSDMEMITEVRLTSSFTFNRNGAEAVDNVRFGIATRQQIAEPASLALLGLGLAGMGIARRRKA